jgi:hypothetical protein
MTLADLWRFLAVALPALGALIATLPSVDLTYHLRAGSEILETGSIPTSDTWTYTVFGSHWIDQQWLAQIILAVTFKLAGWTGLAVLRAASGRRSRAVIRASAPERSRSWPLSRSRCRRSRWRFGRSCSALRCSR